MSIGQKTYLCFWMSLCLWLIFFKSIFNFKASNFNNSIIVYLLRKKIYWDVSYLVLFSKHFELWNFSSSKKTCTMHKIEKGSFSNFKYRENFSFEASCLLSPESSRTILSRCWLISPTKKPKQARRPIIAWKLTESYLPRLNARSTLSNYKQ